MKQKRISVIVLICVFMTGFVFTSLTFASETKERAIQGFDPVPSGTSPSRYFSVAITDVIEPNALSEMGWPLPLSAMAEPDPTSSFRISNNIGGLEHYTARVAFETAYPGLTVEDFEDGNAGTGSVLPCDAPVSITTTGGTCFEVGDILPGILFQDDEGPDNSGLVLVGDGFNGNSSMSLLSNTFADAFDIIFTMPVNAVGMDLQTHTEADYVILIIFAADGSTPLASVVASATNAGTFLGVVAAETIGRIRIESLNEQAEGVDNLTFGYTLGDVDYFVNATVFASDFPGLPVEDFEDGNAGTGNVLPCDAPVSITTTGGTCFEMGDILPGILFQDNEGPDVSGLALVGDGFNGNSGMSLVSNTFADSFDILFTAETNVVGMELQTHLGSHPVILTVYGADRTTMIGVTGAVASNAGTFFGLRAGEPIGRINIASPTEEAEGVDNISFGAFYVPEAEDDGYTVVQNTTLLVEAPGVLGNDFDANGGVLTAVQISNPAHGTLIFSSEGSFVYTPDAGYEGEDSFTYQAENEFSVSEPATVFITVRPIRLFLPVISE